MGHSPATNLLSSYLSWRLKWFFLIGQLSVFLAVLVVIVFIFSHYHILILNHWANFNETWHKASLSKVDSKEGRHLFQKKENTNVEKYHLIKKKVSRIPGLFNQAWHNASLGEGNSNLFKCHCSGVGNIEIAKKRGKSERNLGLQNPQPLPISSKLSTKLPLKGHAFLRGENSESIYNLFFFNPIC